jgi:hypothetical protein
VQKRQYRSNLRDQINRLKYQNQQILSTPSIIDDIFENKQGKLKEHAIA